MADVDWGQAEANLKQKAGQWYDPSMLDDLKRNTSNNGGGDLTDWTNRIANKAQLRGGNEGNSSYVSNGQGGSTVGPTGKVNTPPNPYPTIAGGGLPGGTMGAWAGGGGGFSSGNSSFSMGPIMNPKWEGRGDDLYTALLGRSKQGLNIDPNDPVIANQVNTYRADQQRQARNSVDELAERAGPGANLDVERRMANEHAAQGAGQLRSSLMANELTNRRAEIAHALDSMGNQISDQQKMYMQGQLNQYDLALRQQQLNSSNDQFAAEFGRNTTNDANVIDLRRRGL